MDILDGTPVLDVKPYIPEYDQPGFSLHQRDFPVNSVNGSEAAEYCSTTDLNGKIFRVDAELTVQEHVPDFDTQGDALQFAKTQHEKYRTSNDGIPSTLDDIKSGHSDIVKVADWISSPARRTLMVRFTSTSLEQLNSFTASSQDAAHKLNYFESSLDLQRGIEDILRGDPRSQYRKKQCSDSLYYFVIDTAHVTCWFDGNTAEVLKVQPVSGVDILKSQKTCQEHQRHVNQLD